VPIWALGSAVPQVHESAWVHPSAHLIGNVVVRAEASIWPGAVLRADFGLIEVGEGSSVQDNSVLHPGSREPTSIGRECIVGHCVHLEGALIEDFVQVGSGSIVLQGACVRTGAIVAAGAVVLSGVEVAAGMRAQGVPAVQVPHDRTTEYVRRGAEEYRKMVQRYRAEMRLVDDGAPPVS
jgi:carbonic anhydrase/acetyltransferase-like protein (isoleucine patch superfamily)